MYILFFILGFGLIYFFSKVFCVRLNRIGLVQFVVISLVAFSYSGAVFLYYGLDDFSNFLKVNDKWLIIKMTLMSLYAIIMIMAGSFLVQSLHLSRSSCGYTDERPQSVLVERRREELLYYITILVILIVLFLYLQKVPDIALLKIIDENADLDVYRSLMANEFGRGYHWYSFFFHELILVVLCSSFVIYLKKKSFNALLFFIIVFAITFFASAMALQKAKPVWLFISLVLTYLLFKYNGKISFRSILYSILMVTLALFVVFNIVYSRSDLVVQDMLLLIFSRAFAGSIQPAYHYLEMFPVHHEFLMGRSFPNPMGIFDFEPFELSREVMKFANPHILNTEAVGSMPAVFWAEAYVNFGMIGFIIAPVYVGVVLQYIEYIISKLPHTSLKYGTYVWLLVHYKNLSVTSLSVFIVDIPLILILFFLIVFAVLQGGRRRINNQLNPQVQ